jgi:hypothetical protein
MHCKSLRFIGIYGKPSKSKREGKGQQPTHILKYSLENVVSFENLLLGVRSEKEPKKSAELPLFYRKGVNSLTL